MYICMYLEFPTYCQLIVYLIPMTQRASKFQISLPGHDVCMYVLYVCIVCMRVSIRAESLDPDGFSSFHSPIIDCYSGYFLRVELTEPSRDRYCGSWPRGEINCVVQIPITTAESFGTRLGWGLACCNGGRRRVKPIAYHTGSLRETNCPLISLFVARTALFPFNFGSSPVPCYFLTDIVNTPFDSNEFLSINNARIVVN